jgi:hypothetical protein
MKKTRTPEEREAEAQEILKDCPELTREDIEAWDKLDKISEGMSIQRAKPEKKNSLVQ